MNNLALKITAAFIGGVLLARYGDWPLTALYAAGAILLFAAALLLLTRPTCIFWLIVGIFFICGMIRFIQADQLPPNDISALAGQTVKIQGMVSERPQLTPLDAAKVKVRYVLDVIGLEPPAARTASGRIILTVRQAKIQPIAGYGQYLTAEGKVLLLNGYQNPGAVDSVAALKRQGIHARLAVTADKVKLIEKRQPPDLLMRLTSWRDEAEIIIRNTLPAEQAALLIGLVFGGYQSIPAEIVKEFTLTGIVHILSVSGTHIALIAGVVLGMARRVGLRYRWSAALAALAVLVYAVIAGLTPPVVRSALMGLAALLAVGVGREKDASTALAWSALAMLVYQPALVYDISFQLSFSATAGLVFLYPALRQQLTRLPAGLAAGLAVTAAAQIGILPFLAWYFNTISLSSFAANILVVPIVETVVVIGLAACLTALLLPLAAKFLLIVCGALLSLAVMLTAGLAAIPGGTIYLPPFNLAAGLVYYLAVAWLFGYLGAWLPSLRECWQRSPVYLLAGSLALAVIGAGYICYPRPVAVHFIDVGQGDATLVTTPHGRAVLIDAGGASEPGNYDIGERVVVPYLRHYGILALDYLILTHGHQDHAGGASAVAAALPVKTILLPKEQPTSAVQSLILHNQQAAVIPAYAGQIIMLDGVKFTIIHAPAAASHAGNETSAVIRVSYGNHSFLLTGDLEARQEALLINNNQLDNCTVLKVGHHGARTATSDEFLAKLRPSYAVISVGQNNRYGHPHSEVLKRLQARNINISRTDKHGATVFTSDGMNLTVEHFSGGRL